MFPLHLSQALPLYSILCGYPPSMSFNRDLSDDSYSFVNAVFSVRNTFNFDSQSHTLALHLYSDSRALCAVRSNHSPASVFSVNGEDGAVDSRRSTLFSPANRSVVGRLLSSLLHDLPRLHSCNLARKTQTSTLVFCNSIPVHLLITTTVFTHGIEVFGLPTGRLSVVPLLPHASIVVRS